MKYLVFCECGHVLDRHGVRGCEGDEGPCRCRHDHDTALESAVAQARSRPWALGPNGLPDRAPTEVADG